MITVEEQYFKDNLEACLAQVIENNEPMLVKRESGDVVVLAENTYNDLLENQQPISNKTNNELQGGYNAETESAFRAAEEIAAGKRQAKKDSIPKQGGEE